MEVLHFRVDLLHFIYLFIYYHEGAHFITKVHTYLTGTSLHCWTVFTSYLMSTLF